MEFDAYQVMHDPESKETVFLAVKDGKAGYTFEAQWPFDDKNPPLVELARDVDELTKSLNNDGRPRLSRTNLSFVAMELLRRHVNDMPQCVGLA